MTLHDHANYNPMVGRMVDLIVERIQQNRDLNEVMIEFNAEVELSRSIDNLFNSSPKKHKSLAEESPQTKLRIEQAAGIDVIGTARVEVETEFGV